MGLAGVLRTALRLHGLEFIEENGAFHMTMVSGSRRWRCYIAAQGDFLLCCAQFPWRVSGGLNTLRALKALNATLADGCLMVRDEHVMLRLGCEVWDAVTAGECAVRLLKRCGSEVCGLWDRIYSAAEVENEL